MIDSGGGKCRTGIFYRPPNGCIYYVKRTEYEIARGGMKKFVQDSFSLLSVKASWLCLVIFKLDDASDIENFQRELNINSLNGN